MNAATALLLGSSALFAWSMGSHYTGAVMGTAYGSGVLSLRTAQILAAILTVIGATVGSVHVVNTYAGGLVRPFSIVDVAAAQLAAALVTTASTYFRLPTSTIQIFTFSLLGVALAGGVPIHAAGFGLVIAGWVSGPLLALALGYLLARFGLASATRIQRALAWFVVGASMWSAFTLGSNDVSNAASALVLAHLGPARSAGAWGGLFMALGVLTWGRGLLRRVGHDILTLDVPLAATAQLSQAITLTAANVVGYNASINQTIVAGLIGTGAAARPDKLDRKVLRNILMNWTWSPALGSAAAAMVTVVLHATLGR